MLRMYFKSFPGFMGALNTRKYGLAALKLGVV